jgi:hypothetical protein
MGCGHTGKKQCLEESAKVTCSKNENNKERNKKEVRKRIV